MKYLSAILLWPVLVFSAMTAHADVVVTDWRGESVAFSEGSVDSDGVKIVYHTAGQGPLMLFVHSITGPWFDFRQQMVMLSEHYQVVSMSTRGTDQSDKPTGIDNYTSAKIAGDMLAILDHFQTEKAVIVGHDSGGLHAWHFAMSYPGRTDRLISLGSVHPAGLVRELIDNPDQQRASTFQRNMQENPEAGSMFANQLRNRPVNPDEPDELAALRKQAYASTDPQSIVNFYKANWPYSPVTQDTVAFGFRFGELPPVQAPTLLFYGELGPFFRPATLNDMWEWVDAPLTIHTMPGVGHDPHNQAPEFVTRRIMEWLDSGR